MAADLARHSQGRGIVPQSVCSEWVALHTGKPEVRPRERGDGDRMERAIGRDGPQEDRALNTAGPAVFQIGHDRSAYILWHRQAALAPRLALAYGQPPLSPVDILQAQAHDFGRPEAQP